MLDNKLFDLLLSMTRRKNLKIAFTAQTKNIFHATGTFFTMYFMLATTLLFTQLPQELICVAYFLGVGEVWASLRQNNNSTNYFEQIE